MKCIYHTISIIFLGCLSFNFVFATTKTNKPFSFIRKSNSLSSQQCSECHSEQHKKWQGSHHQKAMAIASKNTVLGDFNNKVFKNIRDGISTSFFMKGEQYFVNTQGPDGEMADFKVRYTFGVEPLQQYLIEFSNGRLQCLPIAWDNIGKHWYHIFPKLNVDHKEWLHWSRGGANWNSMCADCHSTELKKDYDPKTKSYNTTFSEINVGCRSCHGEMKNHSNDIKHKNKSPKQQLFDLGKLSKSTEQIMTKKHSASQLIETCAQCHSRRTQISETYKLGDPFLDHYMPELMSQNTYHGDGQILDEVYVYGSFLQSKMYHKGVSCTHCHEAHSTELKLQGNPLCTQCHSSEQYDNKKHHHHNSKSKGSSCIECHMPGKTYMGIDFRRDHSFRIPRPDQSVEYGTPNACNQCHSDKKLQWAKETIVKWFGPERKPHYSDISLKVTHNKLKHLEPLIKFILDSEQPAFVRASMINYLRPNASNRSLVVSTFKKCLSDKNQLLRLGAALALENWPKQLRFELAQLIIKDPKRAIRIQAVSLLIDIDEKALPKKIKDDFLFAKKEYLISLKVNTDFPSGMLNLGNYYMKLANAENDVINSRASASNKNSNAIKISAFESKAIEAYLETLEIDNRYSAARMNLSHLYNMQGNNDAAKKMLKKVVEQEPDFWGAWYNYGLLLNELKEFNTANAALAKAAKLSNGNADVYYNWALSTQSLGYSKTAENIYLDALKYSKKDIRLLNGLIILYLQRKELSKAKIYSQKIIAIARDNESFYRRHQWILKNLSSR